MRRPRSYNVASRRSSPQIYQIIIRIVKNRQLTGKFGSVFVVSQYDNEHDFGAAFSDGAFRNCQTHPYSQSVDGNNRLSDLLRTNSLSKPMQIFIVSK